LGKVPACLNRRYLSPAIYQLRAVLCGVDKWIG
jgi:hypothetical protein